MYIDGEKKLVILEGGLTHFMTINQELPVDKLTPFMARLRERIDSTADRKYRVLVIKGKEVKGLLFNLESGNDIFVADSFACTLAGNEIQDFIPFVHFFPHPNYPENKK